MENNTKTVKVDQNELIKALDFFGLNKSSFGIENKDKTLFEKAIDNDLKKGLSNDNSSIEKTENEINIGNFGGIEVSAIEKGLIDVSNHLNEQNILIKGLSEELQKEKEGKKSILDRLEKIENTPLPGKSIMSSRQDFYEKGVQDDFDKDKDKQYLSLSKNRKDILNALEARAGDIEKGETNDIFLKGLLCYETSRILAKDVLEELNKDNIIIVE